MAIAGSGAISMSDFRTEFIGGSSAVSLSDFYRGGSNVRSKAANNNATNLAADLPTSGAIAFDDFYGTAKGFRKTYSSGATNQDASSVFGDDYGVNYPKEIVIDSGVELGATSTSQEALQIDSGLSGTMTITNNGTLSGAGGAAGSSGGDAFQADVACTLINNGTMRGGGGGGGSGGTGGQGRQSYSTTNYGSWSSQLITGVSFVTRNHGGTNETRNHIYHYNNYVQVNLQGAQWKYNSTVKLTLGYGGSGSSSGTISPVNKVEVYAANNRSVTAQYQVRNYSTSTGYNYFNGGSGGAGGVGQGYNQAAGSGSGGSSGGTNAGNGGSGGGGGSFGNSGSSGNSGGNGNYTNGSGGSGGGAAGKYIIGQSNVTFTNNGTVQGGIS